jgi:hypothetical protein
MGIPSCWLLFQQKFSIYAQKSTAIVLAIQKKKIKMYIQAKKKLKPKQIQKTSMTSAKQTCSHSSDSSSSMSTAFTIIISLVLCISSMLYAVYCKTKHQTKSARMEKKLIELQELLENLKEKVDQYGLELLL